MILRSAAAIRANAAASQLQKRGAAALSKKQRRGGIATPPRDAHGSRQRACPVWPGRFRAGPGWGALFRREFARTPSLLQMRQAAVARQVRAGDGADAQVRSAKVAGSGAACSDRICAMDEAPRSMPTHPERRRRVSHPSFANAIAWFGFEGAWASPAELLRLEKKSPKLPGHNCERKGRVRFCGQMTGFQIDRLNPEALAGSTSGRQGDH